jgi:uncharacterized membrane protein YsdA (DUF1294 family)
MATGRRWRRRAARWPVICAGRAMALALGVTLALLLAGVHQLLVAWLAGVSVAAFAYYAYDKLAAARAQFRIPERVLLGLALLGGTPGALLSMLLFHHKTRKGSFVRRFGLVALAQVVLLMAWRLASA